MKQQIAELNSRMNTDQAQKAGGTAPPPSSASAKAQEEQGNPYASRMRADLSVLSEIEE